MLCAGLLVFWFLTLGLFVEGQVKSTGRQSNEQEESFLADDTPVFFHAFVTGNERVIYGVPYVLSFSEPLPPFGLNVVLSSLPKNSERDPVAHITHVVVRYEDGTTIDVVSDETEIKKELSLRKLFGREVLGCNLVLQDALPETGNIVVMVKGVFGGTKFDEAVTINVAVVRRVYPGWLKVLFLDGL
ncbi:hypothetical protein Q31b_43290 [Novipirellula aureliae]|uniref:Uncharacterized protein n=1 Tax=Novipirellula aureliae TaxID=2527966 RepID=A0A5C6DPH1_9BACT|nr:hypothetical protein Q31b_43290 [Novipirellula aureliae]